MYKYYFILFLSFVNTFVIPFKYPPRTGWRMYKLCQTNLMEEDDYNRVKFPYDPWDPKGKQKAVFKAKTLDSYLAWRRNASGTTFSTMRTRVSNRGIYDRTVKS